MNHVVKIHAMSFDPADLTVSVLDTVCWHNLDNMPHTATSDATGSAASSSFDTGRIDPGCSSDPVKFAVAGHLAYHCKIHPEMNGTVEAFYP